MIRFDGVSFAYRDAAGERWALSGCHFAIGAGEFVAIVGRNGSGKSTLARLMNGLLLPTSGRVTVGGLDTRDPQHRWEIRRRVGLVFQNPENQLVAGTVEEDVAFGPENLGLSPAEITQRVGEALDAVGMRAAARRPPAQLSGGQKQRVAIAGLLALRPNVLVLDEPCSMLDPSGRRQVRETLARLHREQGLTVVVITQDMHEVLDAARMIVLDQGRVVADGPPAAVLHDPDAVMAWGLELPPAWELIRRLRRRGIDFPPAAWQEDELVSFLCRCVSVR